MKYNVSLVSTHMFDLNEHDVNKVNSIIDSLSIEECVKAFNRAIIGHSPKSKTAVRLRRAILAKHPNDIVYKTGHLHIASVEEKKCLPTISVRLDKCSDLSEESIFELKVAEKFVRLHTRCVNKNIKFGLTFANLKKQMKKKRCAYTGAKFSIGDPDLQQTIDRVDSRYGYVDGNVVACTFKANQLKSTLLEDGKSLFIDIDDFFTFSNGLNRVIEKTKQVK